MKLPRPLTDTEKAQVHPHMQPGADAGMLWRIQHQPNSAIMDLSFVPPLKPQLHLDHEPQAATMQARYCPDCDGPLPARRRYCDSCAKKRKKASHRKSTKRLRGAKFAALSGFE